MPLRWREQIIVDLNHAGNRSRHQPRPGLYRNRLDRTGKFDNALRRTDLDFGALQRRFLVKGVFNRIPQGSVVHDRVRFSAAKEGTTHEQTQQQADQGNSRPRQWISLHSINHGLGQAPVQAGAMERRVHAAAEQFDA